MAIDPVQMKLNGTPSIDEGMQRKRRLQTGDGEGKSFADMIEKAVNSVDETNKNADQKVEDLVAGRTENVHEVMISMQKAQLSFELMTEIRNKLLDTYQQLSRMQM